MNKINVKCPFCGAVFTVDYKLDCVCASCKKTFETDKGAKFYKSFISVEREKARTAKGEAFLKVDALYDQILYFLENEEYLKAEELAFEALKLTEVDFRLFLALVYIKTKKFTDLEDKSHIPYLKKAIALASEEQKVQLKKEYSSYYKKQKMTAQEIEDYKILENEHSYKTLEGILKDGIPRHYKTQKDYKISGVLSLVFIGLAVILLAFSIILNLSIVTLIASLFVILFLVSIVYYVNSKEKSNAFNAVLDLYDAFPTFGLSIDNSNKIITVLNDFAVDYLNNSSDYLLVSNLKLVISHLKAEQNDIINNFLQTNEYVKKYTK